MAPVAFPHQGYRGEDTFGRSGDFSMGDDCVSHTWVEQDGVVARQRGEYALKGLINISVGNRSEMSSRVHRGTRGTVNCWAARACLSLQQPATSPPSNSIRHNISMDFVDSVSKPFKKLKHRFKEHRRKSGKGSRSGSRGGEEHDIEGSEIGQSSCPPLKAQGMAKSGPSGEKKDDNDKKVVQGDPPTSAPSISPSDNGESNGTWAVSL